GAADGLVMVHRAVPERDLATPGNGDKVVAAVIPQPAADARSHDGAGRVAVAADGPVVAERHVAEGQAHVRTRRVPCHRADRPAESRADGLGAGAVPPAGGGPP